MTLAVDRSRDRACISAVYVRSFRAGMRVRKKRFVKPKLRRTDGQVALARANDEAIVVNAPVEISATALVVGVLLLAGVSGFIAYLLLRKDREKDRPDRGQAGLGQAGQLPPPSVYLIQTDNGTTVTRTEPRQLNYEPQPPQPTSIRFDPEVSQTLDRVGTKLQTIASRLDRIPKASIFTTYRLPFLGDPEAGAIRLATSNNVPYEVTVRVVGPPGGMAALAFDPVPLNVPQPLIFPANHFSHIPAGDVIIIPAGQFQTIRMTPRQALFGKGNMGPKHPTGPVVVSIIGADFMASIDMPP